MCQGQVRINSKKLPLDTRMHHPIFLKMRAFLLSCLTGSSICHFTRRAALSWLRQGENNLQEEACSFGMCSGQISHQSLASPANAVSQFISNCNTLSHVSQPWPVAVCPCPYHNQKAGGNLAANLYNSLPPPPPTSDWSRLEVAGERLFSEYCFSFKTANISACDSLSSLQPPGVLHLKC